MLVISIWMMNQSSLYAQKCRFETIGNKKSGIQILGTKRPITVVFKGRYGFYVKYRKVNGNYILSWDLAVWMAGNDAVHSSDTLQLTLSDGSDMLLWPKVKATGKFQFRGVPTDTHMKPEYKMTEDQLRRMSTHRLRSLRMNYTKANGSEGYFEFDIKEKYAEKLQFNAKCILSAD